ncbi:hypothetical protein J1614_002306 [Plenodomus biglobosus]|nr:hypothetical protein J1614_002306 [Plenodomus biglobosus]
MSSANKICGKVLGKEEAKHFLGIVTTFYMVITQALTSNRNMDWPSQKVSWWDIKTNPDADHMDQAIVTAKSDIAMNHVISYEEVKALKYNDYRYNWPEAPYNESLWTRFWWAMAEDSPIYQMRNWFSHELGRKNTTLEQEKEKFDTLLQAYRDLLPVLEELKGKLGAALEDDAAWALHAEVRAKMHDPNQPAYSLDCEAVVLRIKQKEEEIAARLEEETRLYEARLVQMEEEKSNPWGSSNWDYVDVVNEEWSQIAMTPGEVAEDVGGGGGTQDDTLEDKGVEESSEGGDDLPADGSRLSSGWNDVVGGVAHVCPTCACKVACDRQGTVSGSHSVGRMILTPLGTSFGLHAGSYSLYSD